MIEKIEKYRVIILTSIFVLLIGIGLILYYLNRGVSIRRLDGDYYSYLYDNTWRVSRKDKNISILKHKNDGMITIQITELSNDYRYLSIDEIVDEVVFDLERDNTSYRLLYEDKGEITKYYFDGYKLLYESKNQEVMIYLYKKGNQLVSIQYEADMNVFDILLDSVQSIIYSLDVKDMKYSLDSVVELEIGDISYSSDKEFDSLLKETREYMISKNHYQVKYLLPDILVESSIDSTTGNYDYKMNDNRISLKTEVYQMNLYEYLDKNGSLNIYKNYSIYHKEGDITYSDYQEYLNKMDCKYSCYIYKNQYTYNKAVRYGKEGREEYKREEENIELLYELDNNHTFIIKISSMGIPISEKFIKMIEVKEMDHYASNIQIEKDNEYLLGVLKRYSSNKNSIETVTLRVPDTYQEIDLNQNLYLKRYYGYHYHEDLEMYDYDLSYELSPLGEESIVKVINNSIRAKASFGEYHELSYIGDLNIQQKSFRIYQGSFMDRSGYLFHSGEKYIVNKKVLFYNMNNRGNLYIEINGNGREISDKMISSLVNFNIE